MNTIKRFYAYNKWLCVGMSAMSTLHLVFAVIEVCIGKWENALDDLIRSCLWYWIMDSFGAGYDEGVRAVRYS